MAKPVKYVKIKVIKPEPEPLQVVRVEVIKTEPERESPRQVGVEVIK